ncbi:biopolymer transporter ExbD [bacterium]|nr:biopolymer transporter ExbD [bacterium]
MRKNNPFADATTSLIDIAFILILFLVIATVIAPEDVVEMKLPSNYAESSPMLTVSDEIIFQVERSGNVLVNGEIIADSLEPDSMVFMLADTVMANYKLVMPAGKVILRADSGSIWDRPVQIMQAAGRNDISISIALEPAQLAGYGKE